MRILPFRLAAVARNSRNPRRVAIHTRRHIGYALVRMIVEPDWPGIKVSADLSYRYHFFFSDYPYDKTVVSMKSDYRTTALIMLIGYKQAERLLASTICITTTTKATTIKNAPYLFRIRSQVNWFQIISHDFRGCREGAGKE